MDWKKLQKNAERKYSGKTMEEVRLPNPESLLDQTWERINNPHPVIKLGVSTDGTLGYFTEQDLNTNLHIIGSPGEGKSTAIELMLRHFIDQKIKDNKRPGFLLVDPSEYGDTYYRILRYCIDQGFEKVFIIDPHDIYGTFKMVPCINPFRYHEPEAENIRHIKDSLRVLWGGDDTQERRLEKFISALIAVVWGDFKTVAEFEPFTGFNNPNWQRIRAWMMAGKFVHDRVSERHLSYLTDVFKNEASFKADFQPVSNFVQPFLDPTMKLIFGSKHAEVDFPYLISEGYVVLVNLETTGVFGKLEQKLLGVTIINEFIRAVHSTREWGYTIPFTMFIDEVGIFANPKLTEVGTQRVPRFQARR